MIVVTYFRMSSSEQDTSIDAQRLLAMRFAADQKLTILREYVDEGIEGDKTTDRRPAFRQMIADAAKGEFSAILVRDTARLTRSDSIDGAAELAPLKAYGVCILTTGGIRIDLGTLEGRVILTMSNEISHGENRNRAVAVTNGQLQAATAGSWIGSPPFGYRIEGSRHAKRLVQGDARQVEAVASIFAAYVNGDSTEGIAAMLNASGVSTLYGSPWHRTTVAKILRNPAYCGDMVFNKRHYGKYVGLKGGRVTAGVEHGANDPSEWIVHRDRCPAIVDRATWQAAQDRLSRNASGHSPSGGFLLTSLLQCGHDQATLWGRLRSTGRAYLCPACGAAVRENEVIDQIAESLTSSFTAGDMRALRDELDARLGAAKPANAIARIEHEIARQQRKLVVLDADMLGPVQEQIRRLRLALIEAKEAPPQVASVEEVLARIHRLPEIIRTAEPQSVAAALRTDLDGCSLWTGASGEGRRRRYVLKSGEIRVKVDTGTNQDLKVLHPAVFTIRFVRAA